MLPILADIPMFWIKIIGTVFFLLIILWAVFRPKEYIFKGAPNKKLCRDLRIWAVIVLAAQILLYWYF